MLTVLTPRLALAAIIICMAATDMNSAETNQAQQAAEPASRKSTTEAQNVLQRIRGHDFSRNSGYKGVGDLTDDGWRVRLLAIRDLARMGQECSGDMVDALGDSDRQVRTIAALVLGLLRSPSTADALKRTIATDTDWLVRCEAVMALGRIGGDGAAKAIRKAQAAANITDRKHRDFGDHRDFRNRCDVALDILARGDDYPNDRLAAYQSLDAASFNRARVGRAAPDFTLTDTTGRSWKLSDLRGQYVVLIWIFAEWCPVCHNEFHELDKLKADFAKNNVTVLTLECHDTQRCERMTAGHKMWWPHLADTAGKVGATYGVCPLEFTVHHEWINRPSTVIVDPKGIIRWAYYGTYWGDRPTVRQTLDMILTGTYDFVHPKRRPARPKKSTRR